MTIVCTCLFALAFLVHLYIFWLESLAWDSERARRTFGIASREESVATHPLAFNQGFYNLFLALRLAAGLLLQNTAHDGFGRGLIWLAAGSMVAAGCVLLLSDPGKARAALVQLTPPLLGLLAFLLV